MGVDFRKDNPCHDFLKNFEKGQAKAGDECDWVDEPDQYEHRKFLCDKCEMAVRTKHPAQDGLAGLARLAVEAIDTMEKVQTAPEGLDFEQIATLGKAFDRACYAVHDRATAARVDGNFGDSAVDRALRAGVKLCAEKNR